jgi:outer membrane protein OmpA-like peptidoglycan-associated protein
MLPMRYLLLASVLLAPLPAGAEAVDFRVLPKVLSGGRERPSVTLFANEPVEAVEIRLERGDGRAFAYKSGPLVSGQSRSFDLEVPAGREFHFSGTMSVTCDGEILAAAIEFDAEIVIPARLSVEKGKVDLEAGTFEVSSTRPIARVEVAVTGDQGQDLGRTEATFENSPPGKPVRVTWNQTEGKALKIAVRVHDPDQFYSGIELYPWRIDIPHEEVNFATGVFKIAPKEEPKLEKSLSLIREAVAKPGRFAEVKLFIAGHTDTVGPSDSNRILSLNRARSISEYFRKKGLRIPIQYEGLGEEALQVATPDETDEPRNRRAEYIVAIEPPPVRGAGGQAEWKTLR